MPVNFAGERATARSSTRGDRAKGSEKRSSEKGAAGFGWLGARRIQLLLVKSGCPLACEKLHNLVALRNGTYKVVAMGKGPEQPI